MRFYPEIRPRIMTIPNRNSEFKIFDLFFIPDMTPRTDVTRNANVGTSKM